MKNKILLPFILIANILSAQIQDKIQYVYTQEPSINKGAATITALFFKDYDFEHNIKIHGVDDSLKADNIIKVKLNNDTISLYNITGLEIPDSLHVTFFGTYFVRNYDLTPEEKNKKVLSKEGADGVIQLTRVQHDSSGGAYYNQWTNSGSITIPDTQIKNILIKNSDIWVNSKKEKTKMIRHFNRNVAIIRAVEGVVLLLGLTWVLTNI